MMAYSNRFLAAEDQARDALVHAADHLKENAPDCVDPDLFDKLLIVLGETINDIVLHAYDPDDRADISLHIAFEDDGAMVRICDWGCLLPARVLVQRPMPDVSGSVDDLPEGGFGWPLIHRIAEDLEYCRFGGRNTLSFRVR